MALPTIGLKAHYGTFTRSFTLPDSADSDRIKADYKNGDPDHYDSPEAGSQGRVLSARHRLIFGGYI